LDPNSGEIRWTQDIAKSSYKTVFSTVVNGLNVYIGIDHTVTAISSVNGQVLWTYVFSFPRMTPCVPLIVSCGLQVLVGGRDELALLNAADGTPRWKVKAPYSSVGAETGAWDGANCVLIGTFGFVYSCDLLNGTFNKFNLKGCGYHHVSTTYDKKRKVFYAATKGSLFALSSTPDLIWKSEIPSSDAGLALEEESGRIYVFTTSRTISCFDTAGKQLFSKTFSIPFSSRFFGDPLNSVTCDLRGSGKIFLGSLNTLTIFDGDGNVTEFCKPEGIKPVLTAAFTFVCTPTASWDQNASGDRCHALSVFLDH